LNLILGQPKTSMCNNAVLLIGGSGTAKTSSVLMFSTKFDREKMLFKRTNFSSATSPGMFQSTIEAECDFKVGKEFAPPGNKMMTLFIDDMSMPFVNKWGDQITLELVRQLIDQSGFYWLDKTQRGYFKFIKNLVYVGAMNQPGGGRNDIPNRLKRQFMIFNMILPNDIKVVFGPIIKHMFKPKFFSAEVNKVI
jgi:dynein heavy chain, axonemal